MTAFYIVILGFIALGMGITAAVTGHVGQTQATRQPHLVSRIGIATMGTIFGYSAIGLALLLISAW